MSVVEALVGASGPLPWIDPVAFAHRSIELALADRADAGERPGWVVFDRGLVDAVAALEHSAPQTAAPYGTLLEAHRYHRRVFLVPPWARLFDNDVQRRHSFAEAVAEYDRLLAAYPAAGYEVSILPETDVVHRAELVEAYLENAETATDR